mgnify:CR=1 FL=1
MNKTLVKILSVLFPNRVVSFAYNQLTNPQITKLRPHEIEVLETSRKETLRFHDFDIALYTWQGGSDSVLLIHGWEGQAGNFADMIEELLANHYTVYAFDAPSHGYSSKGSTSLFEFTELVGLLIKKFNVKKLVSHSFGGVATTYALYNNKDIVIDKYVLLTTPDKFIERINDVSEYVGIPDTIKQRLIARLEQETGQNVELLNVSTFVQSINVAQALIIHDVDDKVIPIARSRNVHQHWKESAFVEVHNTGHFRILRTKEVITTVIKFLQPNTQKDAAHHTTP